MPSAVLPAKGQYSLVMIHCEVMRFAIVVMLFGTTTLANDICPSLCQCTDYVIDCNGRGLKKAPDVLPLTARRIDLSNNPSIQIQSDYFLRFRYLFILLLNNCDLKGPVYLPRSLRDVRLDNNAFGTAALMEMFQNKTKLLKRVSIQSNDLQPTQVSQFLKILPLSLKEINLSINNVTTLTKKKLGRFKELRTVRLHNCSLKSIEPNVFDKMAQLTRLYIDDGELDDLPAGLFTYNNKLTYLNIAGNRLTQFNATKLGLTRLLELDLGYNQIRAIGVQKLTARKLWLNHNRIHRLDSQLFSDNPFLSDIILSGNSIQSLCAHTFNSVKRIGELSLHTNSLKSLPKDVFRGKTIMKIRLQRNKLEDITGLFDSLESLAYLIDLTENKNIRIINGTDFAALDSTSTIYMTCKDLTKIVNPSKLRAKILCSPNADLVIHTKNTDGLSCRGYACTNEDVRPLYTCRACRKGYFSSCARKRAAKSSCIQCPPGSYYQDEPASITCKTCRPGQFVPPEHSPGRDASDCQTCPQGTNTTLLAGTRACKCLSGYTRLYRFGPCEKCYSDGFNCSQDYPVLKRGFWMTWAGTKLPYEINVTDRSVTQKTCEHVYKAFIKNLDITDDSYDRKTMHYNCELPLPIKCTMASSCLGGIEPNCSTEYKGALCAACKQGYARDFNQCVRCPSTFSAAATSAGFVILFGLLCLIVSATDKIILDDQITHARRADAIEQRTFADVLLSSLKILVGFYQILLIVMQAFSSVYWPHNVKIAIGILQYLQLQMISCLSLHCIRREWEIDAVSELLLILGIIAATSMLVILYYSIKSVYIYCQRSYTSPAKIRRYVCGRNCIKFVAMCLFGNYTIMSTKIIQILPVSCQSFCTLKRNETCAHLMSFLRYDYSIPCPTFNEGRTILIIGFSCLVIPLGIPITLLKLLWKYAPENEPTTVADNDYDDDYDDYVDYTTSFQHPSMPRINRDSNQLLVDTNVPMLTSALRFTYENYHRRYWYWEVTEIARKFLMASGVVIFLGHTKSGLTCTIIMSMIFIMLHSIHKPFKSNFENGAQLLSLIVIPMNLVFGAMLQSRFKSHQQLVNNEMGTYVLSIFLVIMNSILPIILLTRIMFILAKNASNRLKNSQ